MTTVDLIALVAIAGFALAAGSTALAFQARRYAARALTRTHTHPRNPPIPRNLAVDRRLADSGPPKGQPERRRHRAPDELGRARRRDVDDPRWSVDQPEAGFADAMRKQLTHERTFPDQPTTGELEPPTRDMRAIPPDRRPERP